MRTKMKNKRKKGFSLVEILISMSIVVILTVGFLMTINPIAQVNKARDAQRKKDVKKIGASFEEYFNDNGCYPDAYVASLNDKSNCNSSTVFAPWLTPWKCDPRGEPYQVMVGGGSPGCAKWFKVLVKLENVGDLDIPELYRPGSWRGVRMGRPVDFNYGTSSTNISWNDTSHCELTREGSTENGAIRCFYVHEFDGCSAGRADGCRGPNCFLDYNCTSTCRVSCCGNGCP